MLFKQTNMTDTPCRQVSVRLTLAGFDIESIMAIHDSDKRRKALARFNDADSRCKFLVTNFDIGGQGINVHQAASNGYVVQLAHTMDIIVQAMGRLTRIGQLRHARWTILTVPGTYNAHVEARAIGKKSHEYAARVVFGERDRLIEGATRDIIIHEIMRVRFGHTFNRYAWKRLHAGSIGDYHSDETRRMGRFFTLAARLAVRSARAGRPTRGVCSRTSRHTLGDGMIQTGQSYARVAALRMVTRPGSLT